MSHQSTECDAPKQRGPSHEIEQRIAAAIAERAASNRMAAATSEEYGVVDNEILGTYEYLDHTADIQIHSWGDSFSKALEQATIAMFGYMTPRLSLVEINQGDSDDFGTNIEVQGHDLISLTFNFVQEYLQIFHETGFIAREICIESIDLESFIVVSSGKGEKMQPDKHVQGTEVKAVTYSNLQVVEDRESGRFDIWIILDI